MMSGGRGTNYLSHPLPAGAFLGVVQLDPHSKQSLSDLVRAGEVPLVPRDLPLGNQLFNLGIDGLRKLDHIEDKVRVAEHRHRSGALLRRRLSRFQPWIEGFDELEEMPDRRGEIEVISKRLVPAVANLRGCLSIANAPKSHREFIEPLDRAVGRLEQLRRKRERAPVVRARQQRVADRPWRVSLGEEIANRGKVAQPLGHLLAGRILQVLRVQPVAGERLPGRTLALGDLVFVVRKDQVDAASMNVERLSEVLHAHRRAFDVPAGPARPQRRLQRLLAWFARLPEDEVPRVILAVLIDVDPGSRLQAAYIEMRQRAIARKARDPK